MRNNNRRKGVSNGGCWEECMWKLKNDMGSLYDADLGGRNEWQVVRGAVEGPLLAIRVGSVYS